MDADGRHQRVLTQPRDCCSDTGPAWSPDGRTIAFTRENVNDNHVRIYLMDADGGHQHPLVG